MRAPPHPMGHNDLHRPLVVLIILLLHCITCSCRSESDILLSFKESLGNHVKLSSWNPLKPPCSNRKANWVGILCEKDNVWGIKLENMGLSGVFDVESLKELVHLRTISLMNNSLNGAFPKLKKMIALKSVYLSDNKFSGEIDANAFIGMQALKKVHLANNELSGSIPSSLTTLSKLVELNLEGNKFVGEIPDFKLGILRSINVSNNQLAGQIPTSFSKMDASSFSGNENLCGVPLQQCPSPSNPPAAASSKTPVKTIVIVALAVVVVLVVLVIIIAVLCRSRGKSEMRKAAPMAVQERGKSVSGDLDKMEKGPLQQSVNGASRKGDRSNNGAKLSFLRDDIERFELGDLLKASAEVLGSGYFGSSYRAALTTGKMMVVKRFRHMNNVGKEEFQEHMRRIGRLSHPNLLPLVAFYYRKEEKLLVADYVHNVNLAVHLHGNRSRGHPTPDWRTRLKIIKGVAKGLQYLYNELPSLMLPHGHLKSSNVLLTPLLEPLLTDYALVPVVNQEHAQDVMVAYKSPEYKHSGRVTKKTDVWSFGILILEILTGKFPSNILQQGKGGETDLVSWVESVLREGNWDASELFDKEMGEVVNGSEGEMIKLLKIGLACAENDVEKRWDLKEALAKIEQVKEKDLGDEEFYSFATSEGDAKIEK